jgi:hypothetical protein
MRVLGLTIVGLILWLAWPYAKAYWLIRTGRVTFNLRRDEQDDGF